MYRVVRIVTGMYGWMWVEVGHNQGISRIGHTLTAAAALAPLRPAGGPPCCCLGHPFCLSGDVPRSCVCVKPVGLARQASGQPANRSSDRLLLSPGGTLW